MADPIAAIIMVGPAGPTPLEQLLNRALRAAAGDLIDTLRSANIAPIIVASPGGDWLSTLPGVVRDDDPPGAPFHFGQRLAGLITRYRLEGVIYFGGGSAPLLDADTARALADALDEGRAHALALTNNVHSSDWVGFTQAQRALPTISALDRDNSLAWLLENQAGYTVRALSAGIDIDTPTDLAILGLHPALKPRLAAVLGSEDAAPIRRIPLAAVIDVAARAESHLALIGRVAPLAWHALSQATRIWIRVFSEERGMVASGRVARGEARSLLGEIMEHGGPEALFDALANLVDAAIIDSRVLMAHHGRWPDPADRFASDTFDVDAIDDPWLRAFTAAAAGARIPVVLGGHGLVSGGLYTLAEILEGWRARC